MDHFASLENKSNGLRSPPRKNMREPKTGSKSDKGHVNWEYYPFSSYKRDMKPKLSARISSWV